jgi:hypothetical protein
MMVKRAQILGVAGAAVMLPVLLAACTPAPVATTGGAPEYLGIQTALLDGDLVQFTVAMRGGNGAADIADYAACAAAQYALIRGAGFARQVRTNIDFQGGIWRGDAVYTISAALPEGRKTLDAEVAVQGCGARGIPTV